MGIGRGGSYPDRVRSIYGNGMNSVGWRERDFGMHRSRSYEQPLPVFQPWGRGVDGLISGHSVGEVVAQLMMRPAAVVGFGSFGVSRDT